MLDLLEFCRDIDPREPKTDEQFMNILKNHLIVEKNKTSLD